MDDLDRLFDLLVQALARATPPRLATPFPAAEVAERLVPYRSNRSQLRVATYQDYEMTVLRLLAGERGYVRLEPDDVREAMQREVTAVSPDTAFFRNFPDARVMVNRQAADRFLLREQHFAPPAAAPRLEVATDDSAGLELARSDGLVMEFASPDEEEPPATLPFQIESDGAAQCSYCGGVLPGSRKVNFCPHCGQPASGEPKCPACGSQVDVGWSYCVGCGRATGFE